MVNISTENAAISSAVYKQCIAVAVTVCGTMTAPLDWSCPVFSGRTAGRLDADTDVMSQRGGPREFVVQTFMYCAQRKSTNRYQTR